MGKIRSGFAVLGLALMASQAPTAAQEPPDDYAEFVVTAWRSPQEIRKTGLSVTVIDEETIRNSGATRVVDLLKAAPGVRVVASGGPGALTDLYIRGGESNFNLVLVDGVKVNQAGGGYDWTNLPTENIERIEIIRGPGSVTYGGDAASAVIQVFTRRGRGANRVTVFGEGGSYRSWREGVTASGSNTSADWSFSASQYNTDGHMAVNNDYNRTSWNGRVGLAASEDVDLTFTTSGFDATYRFPTDNGGDRLPPFDNDPDQNQRDVQTAAGFSAERRMTERWTLGLDLGLFHSTNYMRDPDNGAVVDPFGHFYGNTTFQRRAANLSSEHRVDGWLLTWGGEIEGEESRGANVSPFGSSTSHFMRTNGAGYLSAAGDIVENLHLTAGIRMDDNSRLAREFSSRGALAYTLPSGAVLRAAGGDGFRSPSIFQLVSTIPTFRPNPDLKGENETQWEAGFDLPIAANRAKIAVTYFDAKTKGLITTVAVGVSMMPQNVADVERHGVETVFEWAITPRWKLAGQHTWMRTRVDRVGALASTTFILGNPVIRRPMHAGSATLSYAGSRFRASSTITAMSHYFDQDFSGYDVWDFTIYRRRSPGYATVDLKAEYDVMPSLTLTATGQNILDRSYQAAYGFSTPGATWLGGLRWSF